jgi:glycyl-tRNA synthetase beta subunit
MKSSLINQVVEGSGLPEKIFKKELSRLMETTGKSEAEMNLEDLRKMAESYLHDVLVSAKEAWTKDPRLQFASVVEIQKKK